MTLSEFQRFVQEHEAWFMGHAHESYFTIDRVEKSLGVRFPASFRWLLGQYGYWRSTGVAALSVIEQMTSSRRPALPSHYVVLATPSAFFFDQFNGRATNPDDERKLGSVVLKLNETTGADDDVAVYWVRGPEEKLNGQAGAMATGRVVRFKNFAEYVASYCRYQEAHATTARVANPRGWTADIGHSYTLEEIQGNLSHLLKLLTEVIVCFEHHLTKPLRRAVSAHVSAAEAAFTPSPSTVPHPPVGKMTVEEGLFAIQQYRTYELTKSITHLVHHRDADSESLDKEEIASIGNSSRPPVAWPVIARSSSTWSVPEETRHLHHGRLYLFPVDPTKAPSPALPPMEHWVMLVKDDACQMTYLMCWLADGTHRFDRQVSQLGPCAYTKRLYRVLTSQEFYCELEDLVVMPSSYNGVKASA